MCTDNIFNTSTNNSNELNILNIRIVHTMLNENTFTAIIKNHTGSGNITKVHSDGSLSSDTLELKVSKYKVSITKCAHRKFETDVTIDAIETSMVQVIGVIKFEEGVKVINDICKILSLACFSQIVPLSYSFKGECRCINPAGTAINFIPIIDINDGETIKKFTEDVWIKYRKNKKSRCLPEIIKILTTAETPHQPLEIKLALVFLVLENLKSTYAKSKENISFERGGFMEMSEKEKGGIKKTRLGFEKLLDMMFSEEKMKPSLRKIVKLRNEIVHFGLSSKPQKSLQRDYAYCLQIIREYIVKFLGYKGDYINYKDPSKLISSM